jgi:hypothetical protein
MMKFYVLTSPNDGISSDEDSGDENDGTFDNLTGNQLQAPAEVVRIHTGGDIHIVGGLDTSDEESEAETPPPTKSCHHYCHIR